MARGSLYTIASEEGTGGLVPGRSRASIECDGTWDIETEAWDKFVCGAVYAPGEAERIKVYSWKEEEAFVDELLSRKRTLWAHNGGRFDTLWLLGHVWKRGLTGKIGLSGSSVASLEVDGVIFRDSARLIPMSLAKTAEIGGERKASTDLPCSCERACGGYCSISRGMGHNLYTRLVSYMVQDCRALYSALDALCTLAERHDLDLRPTIGACAWATVQRGGVDKAQWGDGVKITRAYQHTRNAYYGGRTQVFRAASEVGFHYDITSAYPAALANLPLPCGEREELSGGPASRAYASGQGGVFRANVHVPHDLFLPPLPVRTRQRIAFPVGTIGGWWTSLELACAEARGAKIRRIDEGVVWETSAPLLQDFCKRVWALRDEARTKNPSLAAWYKWLANSLTGKLATKPEVERVTVDPDRPVFCPGDTDCQGYCGMQGCCRHRCTGACGKATPIAAGFPIFSVKQARLSSCSHVEWAAFLTSYTRVELQAFAGESDDLVYCDTDSIFSEHPRSKGLGVDLGQWKLEDRYAEFRALAPKTYAYWDADTGEAKAASKGIPDAVRNYSKLSTGVVNDRGVNTFKSALRVGDMFKRRSLRREVCADGVHFGDRIMRADGRTYPQHAKQVNEGLWELR